MHAVLDVQKNRYIGVDVGGTRLKLGVVSGRGAVSEVENIPTPPTRASWSCGQLKVLCLDPALFIWTATLYCLSACERFC